MKNHTLLLLFIFSISKSFAFSNIECWHQLNKIDSLLSINEIDKGLELYEKIGDCKKILCNTRLYGMSQFYLLVNKKEEAKVELIEAVERGLIWSQTHQNNMLDFHLFCQKLGGQKFQEEIWSVHLAQTNSVLENNQDLLFQLRGIEKIDQLQRDNFSAVEDFIYENTNYENYKEDPMHISLTKQFREVNKELFEKYYSILDSLGYVPSDKETLGQCSMQVLINHSSAYPSSINLDSIYRHSLEIGTISPKAYANYIGYAAQKQGIEDPYLYVENTDSYKTLSADEKKVINKARHEIGLPALPLNMWRVFGLE